MAGVNICPKHLCKLVNSNVSLSSKQSPCLITAEIEVDLSKEVLMSENKIEQDIAKYVATVFESPVNVDCNVEVGDFLQSRMSDTKYLYARGENKRIDLLYSDFSEYYKCLDDNILKEKWKLEKIFSNNRFNTYEICLLAMFLNIPANDLVNMKLPSQTECCRNLLENICVENWIHQYISYVGCNQYVSEENKEYIVYSLAHILNELKPFSEDKMIQYLSNPDTMLKEVIQVGEERNWVLDKHSALGLCSNIVADYVFKSEKIHINQESEEPALKQIIRNYPDEVLNEIYDPVWERYFDQLLDEYDGDEDAVRCHHDVAGLKYLVCSRKLLPNGYELMQD